MSADLPTHVVRVPVTTLWVDPSSPRPVDAAIVAGEPDPAAWLADLDAADARLGLHGLVDLAGAGLSNLCNVDRMVGNSTSFSKGARVTRW